MNAWRLIVASLAHHWRTHVAVGLGVAAATAVLTGALVVGDSVRGSLRRLALDRLGRVDRSLVADKFFRRELVDELAAQDGFERFFAAAVPLVMLEGTIEQPESRARSNRVTLLGIDESFGKLDPRGAAAWGAIGDGEIALGEPLASELGVKVGDEVIVRLPTASDVPRDSPLGRKTETITNRRLKVARIEPASGLGGFSVRPNQQTVRNAFLNMEGLAGTLDQSSKANAILLAARDEASDSAAADAWLTDHFRPTLVDQGVSVEALPPEYVQIRTRRMLFEPALAKAVEKSLAGERTQPVMTYLANTIADGDRQIPYSTIAGVDFQSTAPLGPWLDGEGQVIAPLADDEIALNAWAAEDLNAKLGDEIRVDYFEPESTHGQVREASAKFRLKAIAAMEGAAADADLTPTLPGVTDQLSISDWNPPFPFDSERVRDKDEAYWDEYKATPKAFVSLAAAQKLWGSRFGEVTSVRVAPGEDDTPRAIATRIRLDAAEMGMSFFPARRMALLAARGTTSFSGLFIGFSFFVIAAAVMLVALLFRLGVDQRAREIGVLLAVGIDQRRVRRLWMGEAACVAAAGGAVGVLLGIGYAWLMIVGLTTWWVAAIRAPFLSLAMSPSSLALGFASGVLVSLAVIGWSLRSLRRVSARRLLANQTSDWSEQARPRMLVSRVLAPTSLVAAVALALTATRTAPGEAQAGMFFGAGALVLVSALTAAWRVLRLGKFGSIERGGRAALARLAIREAARNPARGALVIGLVASASFLIVSMSAFRIEPPSALENMDSGTGGFSLVAESDQPIYQDINTDDGRFDLAFSSRDEKAIANTRVYAWRSQPGDDASCLNLYQAVQPRVLGASREFLERGGFQFAASTARTDKERANPWRLLARDVTAGGVPVVVDMATATYSLKWRLGQTYEIDDGSGGKIAVEVVGLLRNSILQGLLVMSEEAFLRHFPDVSGYRFFLVETPPAQIAEVEQVLERTLADHGFDAERTDQRLAGFLAVQNTYLSTFQSLGGLGLLLGTLGLAAVELRSVFERRGELALLRASGFRRSQLARLVMYENVSLLLAGLAAGVLAALVAISGHLVNGGAAVPWSSLAGTLGLVLLAGFVSSMAAVRAVLSAPLLKALRGD